jgi:hypothetical protein
MTIKLFARKQNFSLLSLSLEHLTINKKMKGLLQAEAFHFQFAPLVRL